jgi:hypothetical protein
LENWGDWLGTGFVAYGERQYRRFDEARAFARSLGLRNQSEWKSYCKTGKKPQDIPARPDYAYSDNGWLGYGDWVGTGTVASMLRQYRPFHEARAFVHGLKLKSQPDWHRYSKSGQRPADIPTNPNKTYAEKGWIGMGDWLGTGRIANHLLEYRSFSDARMFVHRLRLKNKSEWSDYCKTGKKPQDIPARPDYAYRDNGWAGMRDWLGNRKADEQRSVRALRGTPNRSLGRAANRLSEL